MANTAASGAAIGLMGSPALVVRNVVMGNISEVDAGGLFCADYSAAFIERNWIVGNSSGWYGGGVSCIAASPTFARNVIARNSSLLGGGMYLLSFASPAINRNTITANSADSLGGGLYAWGFSSPAINNTVLWGNEADEIIAEFESYPVVTYCDVEGGWPGEGNLDVDPLFVLAERRDFRLLWGSLCIDAGHPDSLDGDGTRSDIGAYFFDQDDYLTLYLTPDTSQVSAGGQLGVTYTVINRWAQPELMWVLSETVLPGGGTRTVLGPDHYTLPAGAVVQRHLVHDVPLSAVAGTYGYRSGIGLPPATLYDTDRFTIRVVEP
ncbi:hypothetical protein AMJ71_08250 [candidate division TA06 bacterium SM1_40]|uniref:Right handed beta helix domain-containing protein n=2 Tax=Bacteria division TA06 TaxID=1156500 RepID=A0A0S8JFN8_UNCT6|nr:MAG: hypothetical protein AMJ82_03240 [candidate division TA06 bacterium SM23_40]KPL08488.1 MAG: hypothetical protein AMJ71_08250 [candidate division TA06 bacterium SM1_40]